MCIRDRQVWLLGCFAVIQNSCMRILLRVNAACLLLSSVCNCITIFYLLEIIIITFKHRVSNVGLLYHSFNWVSRIVRTAKCADNRNVACQVCGYLLYLHNRTCTLLMSLSEINLHFNFIY